MGFACAAVPAWSQAPAASEGPDPHEIPVPPIATALAALPGVGDLPVRREMPDVLTLNDGTPVTTPAQWSARRREVREILEYYHVGRMPPAPGNVRGVVLKSQPVLAGKALYRLVHLTFGPDEKLSLNIGIFTPVAGGPFPAVIMPGGSPPGAEALPRLPAGPTQGRGLDVELVVGGGGAAGTAPAARGPGGSGGPADPEAVAARSPALAHGYASVIFNPNDCAEDTTLRLSDGSWAFRTTRFFPAYPGYDWGILGGWVWGTERVVDYLQGDPLIDRTKLVITGVSRIGKAAMIAGAFDDRIAVVAPVASSGLGTPAYRFSGAGRGGKEGLAEMMKKYPNQFSPHLHEFWGQVDRLPFEAYWFMALSAPRPFIALEGDHDQNVVVDAVRRSFLAAQPTYDLLGVKDRLGVNWSDRPHGMVQGDWDALLGFADHYFFGRDAGRTFDHFPGGAAAAAYNVRDFGAAGDGVTKDTAAFQKALDTCAVSGGGDVRVPAGHYLIGSIQMGYRTFLRLAAGAVISGSPEMADYPLIDVRWEGRWQPGHRALIYAANVDHTGIVGPGRIEGNNAVTRLAGTVRGAPVLEPIGCTDLRWEGFSVQQGGTWATHPTYCTDVLIKGVTIRGGRDGIDVDSCKGVTIDGCDIDTGDDAISLKSGRGMDGARLGKACEDVLITHCTLGGLRFACIGIGSETSGGVRNVRIEHTQFVHSRTDAIYIKTRIGRAGVIENITGEDLDVAAGGFLRINLVSSGNRSTVDDTVPGLLGYPLGRNFRFSHVRLTDVTVLAQVTEIAAEQPLVNLTLDHITGHCRQGITLANVTNALLQDIEVTGYAGALLATHQVSGRGLDGAVPLPPVPPAGAPSTAR
jgi:hypothetical protein